MDVKLRTRDLASHNPPPTPLSPPPPPVHYQGTMHEESCVCFALRRPVEANPLAELKPGGAPIDPGELKNNTMQIQAVFAIGPLHICIKKLT